MIACLYRESKILKNNFSNIIISLITVLTSTFMLGTQTLSFESTVSLGTIILCFMQFMTVMFDTEIFTQIEVVLTTPLKIKEVIIAKSLCLSLLVGLETFFYYLVCALYFKSYILNIYHLALCMAFVFFHSLVLGRILYTFLKKSKIWITITQILLFVILLIAASISQKTFIYSILAISSLYIIGLFIKKNDDKEQIIKRSIYL